MLLIAGSLVDISCGCSELVDRRARRLLLETTTGRADELDIAELVLGLKYDDDDDDDEN